MLHPNVWWRALTLRAPVYRYPPYLPPHFTTPQTGLSLQQASENFRYFINTREARRQYLGALVLGSNASLDLNNDSLRRLSDWLGGYGGFLTLKTRKESRHAFELETGPWIGAAHGLNVVWDIGTFMGDFIINRQVSSRWEYVPKEDIDISQSKFGHLTPYISSDKKTSRPMSAALEWAMAKRETITVGGYSRHAEANAGHFESMMLKWAENAPAGHHR